MADQGDRSQSQEATKTASTSRVYDRSNEPTLDQAMERYADGDESAFRVLYQSLGPRVLRYLTRLSGSPQTASDLTQEVFLRVHRARGNFNRGEAVVPWVYAIARNVHLDHARAAKLRTMASLDAHDDDDVAPVERVKTAVPDAEQVAIASQVSTVVERVLNTLPESQKEAFLLLRFEGMSVAEAATIVGTTETAIKLRAFRAYEALRAALEVSK